MKIFLRTMEIIFCIAGLAFALRMLERVVCCAELSMWNVIPCVICFVVFGIVSRKIDE